MAIRSKKLQADYLAAVALAGRSAGDRRDNAALAAFGGHPAAHKSTFIVRGSD
jgi:hypothetical protein